MGTVVSYLHSRVHFNTFYKSNATEPTQESTNKKCYEKNVVHIHNGILLSFEKNLPLTIAWKNPEDSMLNETKPGTKRQLYLEAKKQNILKQIERQ